jgi:hypothetical protein
MGVDLTGMEGAKKKNWGFDKRLCILMKGKKCPYKTIFIVNGLKID